VSVEDATPVRIGSASLTHCSIGQLQPNRRERRGRREFKEFFLKWPAADRLAVLIMVHFRLFVFLCGLCDLCGSDLGFRICFLTCYLCTNSR